MNLAYVPRIDHLRFLAAAWVLLYHTTISFHPDPTWTTLATLSTLKPDGFGLPLILHGHMGVGLFIVLSGVTFALISHGRKIIYSQFIYNRLLRIYPLYLFWIFLIFNLHSENNTRDLFLALFPFLDLRHSDMIQSLSTLWSVVIEMQIYLLFPFLKIFYDNKKHYALGIVGLLLIIRLMVFLSQGSTTNLAYWTIFGRLDQFMIGFVVGNMYVEGKFKFLKHWSVLPISLGLFVLIIKGFNLFGGGDVFTGELKEPLWIFWPAIEGVIFASLIIIYMSSSLNLPQWLDKTLSRLGELSYSLYVIQFLVLVALAPYRHHFMIADHPILSMIFTWVAFVLPVSLGVSWFTYTFIERPFLGLRHVYTQS